MLLLIYKYKKTANPSFHLLLSLHKTKGLLSYISENIELCESRPHRFKMVPNPRNVARNMHDQGH